MLGRCRTYERVGQKLVAIAYEDNWYVGEVMDIKEGGQRLVAVAYEDNWYIGEVQDIKEGGPEVSGHCL